MPSGGQPAPLSENLVDPDGHNVLAGHLVAATLSLTFDAYDPDFGDSDGYLGDLVFNSGDFSGWTISELLAIANEVYGGCNTDYSYSQITSALTTINENFVDGDSDNGNFDCEGCPDDEAPELVPEPENFSVECNEEIPEADYEAIDNYDPDPTVEFEEWIVEGDDPCTYEIHRHWVLTDDCENTSEYNQIISVSNNDTEAPVFDDVEAYYLLECDGLDDIVVTATDNCGNVTITHEDIDYSGGGCFGVVERTWTATDDCGNSATTSAVIEIDDTTPPEISGVGEDYTVDCEDYPAIDEVTVSDNCSADEDIEVVFEESTLDGDCDGSWVIVRTWTATDECGNSASVTQNITGVDNEPPVFTSVGEGVTIECDEDAPAPEYEVEDFTERNI